MTFKLAGLALSGALVVALTFGEIKPVAADMDCASSDEAACKAEKDERMAIYGAGRNAYEKARTSGDFTEAYTLSRKLALTGDKNGERLLKMVYMQLGWGAHKDLIQAYGWLSEGVDDGIDYLPVWRDKLAEKLSPEQLAEAKKKAGN